MEGPLGRRPPSDWTHVDKYPLTARTAPAKPSPVVIGVNWYAEFDKPQKDAKGHYWIARDAKLTRVRGGHCVCLKPKGHSDPDAWWDFYNQGTRAPASGSASAASPPSSTASSTTASGSTTRRRRSTSGRARTMTGRASAPAWTSCASAGHCEKDGGLTKPEHIGEGIKHNRWARSVDDVLTTLGYGGLDYVDVLNSWGRSYPHLTRMPAKVLERLWKEDGEVGIVTDR